MAGAELWWAPIETRSHARFCALSTVLLLAVVIVNGPVILSEQLFHPTSASLFTPGILVCLVSVRRLALRSPGCHTEAPAGIKNGLLPFHPGGSVTGSGPCRPSSSRTPLENKSYLVRRRSSMRHLNSSPSHGLSGTFQSASQSPLQTLHQQPRPCPVSCAVSPAALCSSSEGSGPGGSRQGLGHGPQEALLRGSPATDRPRAFTAGAPAHLLRGC